MATITTNIQITNGNIKCSPNDGYMRGPGDRTQLQWVSGDEEFTLSFVQLGVGRAWPFKEPEPVPFPATKRFVGTLKAVTTDPPPAYKYTVAIGSKVLDPIIIVDK
jgi:hypothetical protein